MALLEYRSKVERRRTLAGRMLPRWLACIFLLLSAPLAVSAQWRAPVTHYTVSDYRAGTQNWAVSVAPNGWYYAANNYGLLEYDGSRWQLYGVRNSTPVRSLMIGNEGQVYAGASNEFGVFRANDNGSLTYSVLSDSVPDSLANFGEVWRIHSLADDIYFQTDYHLFKVAADGHVSVFTPGNRIFCSATIHGGVYFATYAGMFSLVGGQPVRLAKSSLLQGTEVRQIIDYNGNMLIATTDAGLFVYDGQNIQPMPFSHSEFIQRNKLYSIAASGSTLAIGTVRGGLLVTDTDDESASVFAGKDYLQNNTVLSLTFDRAGNLIAGLDTGIDLLMLQSPIEEYVSDLSLGSGYASASYNGDVYWGTNQGLFYSKRSHSSTFVGAQAARLQPATKDLRPTAFDAIDFIESSAGQVWSLDVVGGVLLCSHHKGLFSVRADKFMPVITADGFWKVRHLDGEYAVAGSYSGFYLLRIRGGKVEVVRKMQGFNQTAMNFEVDNTGNIWALGPQAVCRLKPDEELQTLACDTIYKLQYAQDYVRIFRLGDRVLITGEHFCRIVDRQGQLRKDEAFFGRLGGEHLYSAMSQGDTGDLWFIRDNAITVLPCQDPLADKYGAPRSLTLDRNRLLPGFEHIQPLDGHNAVVGVVNGFAKMSSAKFNIPGPAGQACIRAVQLTGKGDTVVYGESYNRIERKVNIGYDANSIRIRFGGIVSLAGIECQTRLDPLEKDFGRWTESQIREYTSLHEGNYTFHVKIRDIQTGAIYVTSWQFAVSPPWYRSWWAFCIYILLTIAALFMINAYFGQVVAAARERVQREKDKELHEREKQHLLETSEWERQVLELQQARTDHELKNKSQELSHLLLNHVNLREFADNVQEELQKVADDVQRRRNATALKRISALNDKLNAEQPGDVDWKRFEDNFDIVNDKFIKKLTSQYPWLNKNERHLCVYIRMGLFTKEIAPLLNLSTRGVEMLRYRMRKKMGLDRDVNLEQYFRQFAEDAQ